MDPSKAQEIHKEYILVLLKDLLLDYIRRDGILEDLCHLVGLFEIIPHYQYLVHTLQESILLVKTAQELRFLYF